MTAVELRDSDAAKMYLIQGVWLQRLSPTTAESIKRPLACALSLAAADCAVPPAGFVADVIRLALGERISGRLQTIIQNDLPPEKVRAYEDYVLGKLYADASFERASVAICRYEEADRLKAIAWMIGRLSERIGFGGVTVSPSVARNLQGIAPEEVVLQGGESLGVHGLTPMLEEAYDQLIHSIRAVGEVLSAEDVFELERGTALIEFGQRLALRQVLRAAQGFCEMLPRRAPRPISRSRNVPTHILEEDTYPIGGFTSISTRGSIESLLHSELAYMETDESRRPDLFEIKFQRSELLYYSRDENQFLRLRRTIQFVFFPDLRECRIKDDGQQFQRLILILGLQVSLVRKLIEWLSNDSLLFEFLFVSQGGDRPLQQERELLEMVLSEQIQHGTVVIDAMSASQISARAEDHARRSFTHSLIFSTTKKSLSTELSQEMLIRVASANPELHLADEANVTVCSSFDEALQKMVAELM